MATPREKNHLAALSGSVSRLGLKVGVPVAVVAALFILYVLFGNGIRNMPAMKAADKAYLVSAVTYAAFALRWASVAIALALVLRHFYNDVVGQFMALGGLLVFFGAPIAAEQLAKTATGLAGVVVNEGVGGLCRAGATFFVPGLWLVLNNVLLRVWQSVTDKDLPQLGAIGESAKRKVRRLKPMSPCWETWYCNGAVRGSCPAFNKRKSCWRMKSGCMCDERIFLQAAAGKSAANVHQRGFMDSLGLTQAPEISAKAKRARCRRCSIFAEHQRQKYAFLVPIWLAAVIGATYIYYQKLVGLIEPGLRNVDRFLTFVVTSTIDVKAPESGIQLMAVLIVVWMVMMVVGYSLRALEYLIFDLQV